MSEIENYKVNINPKEMIKTLNEYDVDVNENLPYNELLKVYLSAKKRFFIRDKKYEVVYTNEFILKSKMLTKIQRMALADIKYRIEENLSIKPYLSNYGYLNKFSKEDRLLTKYGIYHLHISCTGKKERIVKRTNRLLYITCIFDKVYFLDIEKHFIGNEWNDNKIIEQKNRLTEEVKKCHEIL